MTLTGYYGGKANKCFQEKISLLWPESREKEVFCEPFSGNGVLTLNQGKEEWKTEVLNDADIGIATLLRVLADREKGKLLIERLKVFSAFRTEQSRREIPMLQQVADLLQEIKQKAEAQGLGKGEDYVFCLSNGLPLSRFRIMNELKRIERDLSEKGVKIGHITCHTLRHTFATHAIEGGMKPQILKTILGHSSICMTMDLYSHVLQEEKEQEMELLEGSFDDGAKQESDLNRIVVF